MTDKDKVVALENTVREFVRAIAKDMTPEEGSKFSSYFFNLGRRIGEIVAERD